MRVLEVGWSRSPREDKGPRLVAQVRKAGARVGLYEPPAPALGSVSRLFSLLFEFSFSLDQDPAPELRCGGEAPSGTPLRP